MGGPQGRSVRAENLVPTGIRSRTIQPVVSRYTDWATGPTFCDILYINCTILSVVSYVSSHCNMICLGIFPHFTLSGKLVVSCREAWIIPVAKGPAFLAEIFRDFPLPVLANAETVHNPFFHIFLKSSLVNAFFPFYTFKWAVFYKVRSQEMYHHQYGNKNAIRLTAYLTDTVVW